MSRILHVAPGGSDLHGDGSARRPFQSIARAVVEQDAEDLIVEGHEYGDWPADEDKPVVPTAMVLAALLGGTILGTFIVAAIVMNPSLAVWIASATAVLAVAVIGDDR